MCRKLRQAEEDSLSAFICLQEKKKEAKVMREALEAKKEVRKLGWCWGLVGRVCWRAAEGRVWLWVRAAVTLALCCQELKDRMKAVARWWRDLHTQAAELKTHMEESLRIVKVSTDLSLTPPAWGDSPGPPRLPEPLWSCEEQPWQLNRE